MMIVMMIMMQGTMMLQYVEDDDAEDEVEDKTVEAGNVEKEEDKDDVGDDK